MNSAIYNLKRAYALRHDGSVFDAWNGRYPTFVMNRRDQVRFWVRTVRKQKP